MGPSGSSEALSERQRQAAQWPARAVARAHRTRPPEGRRTPARGSRCLHGEGELAHLLEEEAVADLAVDKLLHLDGALDAHAAGEDGVHRHRQLGQLGRRGRHPGLENRDEAPQRQELEVVHARLQRPHLCLLLREHGELLVRCSAAAFERVELVVAQLHKRLERARLAPVLLELLRLRLVADALRSRGRHREAGTEAEAGDEPEAGAPEAGAEPRRTARHARRVHPACEVADGDHANPRHGAKHRSA
eukprot:CAMPEP_0184133482 /NCGR_PEP_ID=MMETSP0974-20121125/29154_1 /TAXON_ID=483370 /ORGANISM="non described non described, Strain CCMP2097" /LENGTH=247 /DNA_ID=CAMNT_0026437009 /DNA_START=30 /DNA_END=769 /DNA_ORIENTATION=+